MQVNRRYGFASVQEVERPGSVGPAPDGWTLRAVCRTTDPEAMFVGGAAQHRAARVCMDCPVRLECLTEALDDRIEYGVWGGLTERQRRALLRARPDVTSWRELLETAWPERERAGLERMVRAAEAADEPRPRGIVVRAPRLDPAKALIDAMLREDLDAPQERRHTARRVHARLVDEHRLTRITYSTVRDYVRERRPQIRAEAARPVAEVAGGAR